MLVLVVTFYVTGEGSSKSFFQDKHLDDMMWEETISPSFHLLHGHRPIVMGQIWPCVCACWVSQVHICNIQDQFPMPMCFGVLFIKLAFSEVSPGRMPEVHFSFGKSSVTHEEVEAACRRCVASEKKYNVWWSPWLRFNWEAKHLQFLP